MPTALTDAPTEVAPAAAAPAAPEAVSAPAAESAKAADSAKTAVETAAPAKAEAKPEAWALKLPDGAVIDAKELADVEAFAKENGISAAVAQKMVDNRNAERAALRDANAAQLKDTVASWVKTVESDKEFGGAKYRETVDGAKRVFDRFGDADFKADLDRDNGAFGNHAGLVRFAARIARAMSEDKSPPIGGETKSGPSTFESVMYPSTTKS